MKYEYEWTKEQLRDWQNYNHLVANEYALLTIRRQRSTIETLSQSLLNLQRFQLSDIKKFVLEAFGHETARHLRPFIEKYASNVFERGIFEVAERITEKTVTIARVIIPEFIYSYAMPEEK